MFSPPKVGDMYKDGNRLLVVLELDIKAYDTIKICKWLSIVKGEKLEVVEEIQYQFYDHLNRFWVKCGK